MRGHSLIRGCFLRGFSHLPHDKESAMKEHLSYRDSFCVDTDGSPDIQVLLYYMYLPVQE